MEGDSIPSDPNGNDANTNSSVRLIQRTSEYGVWSSVRRNHFHGGRAATIMKHGHAGIQGSDLIGLAGCGHTVQMDCAPEYNAAVLDFLADLARAPERP